MWFSLRHAQPGRCGKSTFCVGYGTVSTKAITANSKAKYCSTQLTAYNGGIITGSDRGFVGALLSFPLAPHFMLRVYQC